MEGGRATRDVLVTVAVQRAFLVSLFSFCQAFLPHPLTKCDTAPGSAADRSQVAVTTLISAAALDGAGCVSLSLSLNPLVKEEGTKPLHAITVNS